MNLLSIISFIIILLSILFPFLKRFSFAQSIVISNFIVFFITTFSSPNLMPSGSIVFKELAFNPIYFHQPLKLYTLLTSMFIHADIWHILLNMIGFIFIGFPFESEIGSKKFAFIYITTGIFAAIFFSIFQYSNTYLIGASGAIFGILAAFAALKPFKKVVIPLFMPIIIFIRMPVIVVAILYAGMETIYVALASPDGIAHVAHIGGFLAGVLLSFTIRGSVAGKKEEAVNLKPYLTDERQLKIYEKAMSSKEPEIRDAWLSYLLKDLRCPKCGGKLVIKNGKLYCKNCGYI